MNLFRRKIKLVQVEVPKDLGISPEGRRSLASLKDHPGFIYLISRLRLQRAALESALKFSKHENFERVLDLQAGIRWMMWLENQFLLAIQHPDREESRDPNAEELEALALALANIEGVGE